MSLSEEYYKEIFKNFGERRLKKVIIAKDYKTKEEFKTLCEALDFCDCPLSIEVKLNGISYLYRGEDSVASCWEVLVRQLKILTQIEAMEDDREINNRVSDERLESLISMTIGRDTRKALVELRNRRSRETI